MDECGFFVNDTATTEIYTLSLHDALPISAAAGGVHSLLLQVRLPPPLPQLADPPSRWRHGTSATAGSEPSGSDHRDRKSTRLNSSHANISYAVFCLKKKKLTPSVYHFQPS